MREKARKINSVVLQRLASVKNAVVADALGCSDSGISRIAGDEKALTLRQWCETLAALDLEIVESEQGGAVVNVPRDEYEALRTLARRSLQ